MLTDIMNSIQNPLYGHKILFAENFIHKKFILAMKHCYMHVYLYYIDKNTLGVKVRGQSEAALQTGATKNFDIG